MRFLAFDFGVSGVRVAPESGARAVRWSGGRGVPGTCRQVATAVVLYALSQYRTLHRTCVGRQRSGTVVVAVHVEKVEEHALPGECQYQMLRSSYALPVLLYASAVSTGHLGTI
eukprot:1567722-Rhodomonas_salina.2